METNLAQAILFAAGLATAGQIFPAQRLTFLSRPYQDVENSVPVPDARPLLQSNLSSQP